MRVAVISSILLDLSSLPYMLHISYTTSRIWQRHFSSSVNRSAILLNVFRTPIYPSIIFLLSCLGTTCLQLSSWFSSSEFILIYLKSKPFDTVHCRYFNSRFLTSSTILKCNSLIFSDLSKQSVTGTDLESVSGTISFLPLRWTILKPYCWSHTAHLAKKCSIFLEKCS